MMTPPVIADDNTDLFSQNINYNNVDAAFQGAPQYNGNISATSWQVAGRAIQGYGYTYDDLDRMTEAKYFDITPPTGNVAGLPTSFSSDFKYNEKLTYDKRGNILTLERRGLNGGTFTTAQGYTAGTFGMIDNLTYSINDKNQLTTIAEASLLNKGFKKVNQQFGVTSTPSNYTYDTNGNMISDQSKSIVNIEYNYLNLPQKILFIQNNCDITFIYDASGVKLRKLVNQYGTITTYDYVNGIEYKNNSLERIANTEGAVTKNVSGVYEYEYVLRDHLGNTRATFSDANNDGTVTSTDIKQINHYYPFGLNMEGNWTPKGANGEGNKYQYNGKELNEDFGLNWNDYGARFYDAAVGRWNAVDPLSEKFISNGAYNYVKNRPTISIDPDGRDIILIFREGKGDNYQETKLRYGKDGKLYNTIDDKLYKGNSKFINSTKDAIDKIRKAGGAGAAVIDNLIKTDAKHKITNFTSKSDMKGSENMRDSESRSNGDKGGSLTYFDPDKDRAKGNDGTDAEILGHELKHGYNRQNGIDNSNLTVRTGQNSHRGGEMIARGEEVDAVNFQNAVRSSERPWLLPRSTYGVDISSKLATPTVQIPYSDKVGY